MEKSDSSDHKSSDTTATLQDPLFEEETCRQLTKDFPTLCAPTGAKVEEFECRQAGLFTNENVDVLSYTIGDNGTPLVSLPDLWCLVLSPGTAQAGKLPLPPYTQCCWVFRRRVDS